MYVVLLVIHLFVTLSMIAVILVQRGESGVMGHSTLAGVRGRGNFLTHLTAFLAVCFFSTNLLLAYLVKGNTAAEIIAPPLPSQEQPLFTPNEAQESIPPSEKEEEKKAVPLPQKSPATPKASPHKPVKPTKKARGQDTTLSSLADFVV